MKVKIRVLIVEADAAETEFMQKDLERSGLECMFEIVKKEEDMTFAVNRFAPDIILAGYSLTNFSGLSAFDIRQTVAPATPFIFVGDAIGAAIAIELIRNGVTDIAFKNDALTLADKVNRSLQESLKKKQRQSLRAKETRKIQQSNKFKADLLNTIGQAVIATDVDGHINFWNKAASEIYGWDEGEILGKNIVDIISTPKTQKQVDEIMLGMQQGKPWSGELDVRRKSGWVFPVYVTSSEIYNEDQKLSGFIGVSIDITDRKRIEQQLIANEQQLRIIYNSIRDFIFLLNIQEDGQFKFLSVNHAFLNIIGLPENEVIDQPADVILPVSLWNKIEQNFQEVLISKNTVSWQDVCNFTGSPRIVEVSITPVLNNEGNCYRLLVSIHDSTKQADDAAKIRSSEQRHRTLFQQNLAGLYQTNLAGDIINCNEAFARMLKYDSARELMNVNAFDLYFSRDERTKLVQALADQKRLLNYEVILKCKDGDALNVIENISLHHDAITGEEFYDGILIDITERKKTEREMSWLINNTEESFVLLNTKLEIITFNGQAERLYKEYLDKEFIKGASILNYAEPERRKQLQEIYSSVLSGAPVFSEIKIPLPDHSIKNFTLIYKPAKDENDQIIGIFISAVDSTERKHAQEQLVTKERRFRALVENGGDAVVVISPENRLMYASPAVSRILGYSEEEVMELNLFSLLHPDDFDAVSAVWAQVIANPGVPIKGHTGRMKHQNGTWRWVEAVVTNLIHEPALRGIVNNFRDVTDEVNANMEVVARQKLLEQAEANYREIFDKASEGIFIHDIETGCIIDVNERACEILGSKKEDITHIDPAPFIANTPGFTIEIATEKLRKAASEGPQVFEWVTTLSDGSLRWMEVSLKTACIAGVNRILAFFRIIDDRKKAELQKEFERLDKEALINTTSDFIWSISSDYKLLAANNAFIDYLANTIGWRLKPGDALIMDGLFPDEMLTVWRDFYQKALRGESFIEEIHTPAWGKSRETWAETRFNPIYNGDLITGVACYTRDTTDTKLSRIKLLDLNNKMEIAQQLAQLGYWEVDLNLNSLYWSNEVYRIWGVNKDTQQVGFADFYESIHTDDRNAFNTVQKLALDGNGKMDVEHRIVLSDGNIKWVHEKGALIYDENGEPLRLEGTVQDITSRKNAEAELTELTNRLKLATTSAGLGIWDWSIDDNHLKWDDKMYRLYGVDEGTFRPIVEEWLLRIHPDDQESIKNHMRLAIAGEKPYDTEFRIVLPDESVRYIRTTAIIERDEHGIAKRMIGANWDVTERRLAEIQMNELNESVHQHVKELAISNAELEQFAYVASHDLQEPLRMVTSFLNMLEKKYSHVIDDKGKEYIHFAVDGAKRMRQIILDLLEFSRVGAIEDKMEKVDLNELVSELNIMFKRQTAEKNAFIRSERLPVIYADITPLRQVFQNLVSNALKYRKKEVPPQINISVEEENDKWIFSVADNGIGIPAEYFDKIFIIFQRLHNRNEFSGTGMGLAITKKIIENLGGKIWVASTEGVGTTFFFTIPKN